MTYGVSPGVYTEEVDLTTVISSATSAVAAFAGNFKWGPVEQPVLCSSEDDVVSNFLAPDAQTQVDFLTIASYLAYPGFAKVVRAYSQTALNATTADYATPGAGTGLLVKNADAYSSLTIPDAIDWIARCPGAIGNGIKVYVVPNAAAVADLQTKLSAATTNADKTALGQISAAIGRRAPSTTDFASSFGSLNDEIHIFVVDYAGGFTGVPGTILESYLSVSLASNAVANDGSPQYYVSVINNSSKYIWWGSHASVFNPVNVGTPAANGKNYAATTPVSTMMTYTFGGGTDGVYPLTDSDYISAYELFNNKETIDIAYVIMGARTSVPTLDAIQNIAETRKDCIVFCSPPAVAVVGATDPLDGVIAYRDASLVTGSPVTDTLGGYSSSYAFLDSGWKYMFNKYTNNYAWVPLNGDTAGLAANTDSVRAAWYSIAGYNRGIVKNAIKLAWNPNEAQRDDLYKVEVNPVVSFPGKGVILYGDKTLQSKPSAFDRINVRRLFIVLEKAISEASKYSLFEFNDEFTRAQFVGLVEPFLRDVQGRRGITDFKVVCDDSNNTPQVIDTNSFIGAIYVKPARSINYIKLQFVAVPTGVSFTTVVGSF